MDPIYHSLKEVQFMTDELKTKIHDAIESHGYEVVVAVGVDNFTYISGVVLPFAANYPDRKAVIVKTKNEQSCVICPFDWSGAINDQGWKGNIVTYDENEDMPPRAIIKCLTNVLSDLGLEEGRVGLDVSRASRLFVEALGQSMSHIDWVPCDNMFRDLRIVKTKAEVELLEMAAKQAERGIIGALNHLEGTIDVPGYTLSEFSERVRVHIAEFGGSGTGHLATMQGVDIQLYYAPQCGKFSRGNLVRINVTNHYRGYWSNAGRMAIIGEPTDEQAESYNDNLVLKATAAEMLKPGVRCSEVFEEVEKRAAKEGIKFWREVGIGHGVGVSHREAPYLSGHDGTLLQPGMVLVLDLYTYGPHRELIHSKDTYEIVEDGCRLMSWYRSWDRLYAVTGFRASH